MKQLTVGSLFSGIGGLDLGLEQAGMKTVWQVEFDDWARGKLDENFPETTKFKDVRDVGKHNLEPVDLICGGFPCQDISIANLNGKGIDGEKSGLWSEYARIIRELRPKYALIENVSNFAIRGLERVLSDLARVGFNARWFTLRASSFGLSTKRKRMFVFAYAQSLRPVSFQFQDVIDFEGYRPPGERPRGVGLHFEAIGRSFIEIPEHLRMDNGLSFELSEIEAAVKGYGNAVCPPVAKWIGERIIEFDNCR